jgi:Nuclease-related domain/UvrD-like helicase C-terminal domain
MATLFPESVRVKDITNASERYVVDLLVRQLGADWIVSPGFRFRDGSRDREIDVILIHPVLGMIIVEVKGGRIEYREGRWIENSERENPEKQAFENSYGLRQLLNQVMPEKSFKVGWAVCLPRSSRFSGDLPDNMHRNQLMLSSDLEDPEWSIELAVGASKSQYSLSPQQIQMILNRLYPKAQFEYDPDATLRSNRERLLAICDAQVDALSSLDVHNRVVIVGGAGTGKTYLANRWATIYDEPRRVLLTCYNEPLGEQLSRGYPLEDFEEDSHSIVYAGAFLQLLTRLPGLPELTIANTGDNEFWEVALPTFVLEHIEEVEIRFDRIIVDEAQDFSPLWIEVLEHLLDPEGDDQLFFLYDPFQRLADRGFTEPSIEDGWVRAELRTNVRNSLDIARLARKFLGGAAPSDFLPASQGVSFHLSPSDTSTVRRVGEVISGVVDEGVDTAQILVVAGSSALRDQLRTAYGFGTAEERFDGIIACETPHRAKGLEADIVIVAGPVRGMSDAHLYVAITRAVNELIVVAPEEILVRLGAKL